MGITIDYSAIATPGVTVSTGVSSVNDETGAVTIDATEIDISTLTPSNYSPVSASIEGHLTGIDTALGAVADATLTSLAALGTTADRYAYTTGVDTWAEGTITSFARTLLDDADAATARTTLDVDQAGTDNSTDVTLAGTLDYLTITGQQITRNAIDLAADVTGSLPAASVSLADAGGLVTATDVEGAIAENRTAIDAIEADYLTSAAIGSTVQGYDGELAALAGLTSAADKVPYFTGAGTAGVADFTAAGRSMSGAASATAQTALLDAFTGDAGAGGVKGLVPAPITGDATKFLKGDGTWTTIPGGGDALTSSSLAQFAATTSAELAGVVSDETGSGALVFATSPTLVTPALGTPASGTLTNCTGLPLASVVDSTTEALGVGSIELGHATDTTIARVSAGVISVEGSNVLLASGLGSITQAYDVDTLKADTADVLTAGFAQTPYSAGTFSTGTYTPDEANGNLQYATNNGAHTLAPPSNSGTMIVLYANGASAGAITTSGFTMVTGDSFTTTNGHEFLCYITKHNNGSAFSHLHVTALQ